MIPNKLEAQLILDSDSDDPDVLACELLRLGIKQVVLTIGEQAACSTMAVASSNKRLFASMLLIRRCQ